MECRPIEWRVPVYLPYVQPALTQAAIDDAERHLGLRLPAAYVDALRVQNGGCLRYVPRDYGLADQLWGIGPQWPSILEGSLAARYGDDDETLPRDADRLVPFVGDGHWFLCFDARDGRDEPAITYIDLEWDDRRVAETFAELTTMIGPNPERRQVGLSTEASLAEAAGRLGAVLAMPVNDQGDQAHGYPTFHLRGAGGGGDVETIEQLWVTPNEVRRGFVRPHDRRYTELVNLLPGTALRVPEHPDCTLLVSWGGLDEEVIVAACARAGLRARVIVG